MTFTQLQAHLNDKHGPASSIPDGRKRKSKFLVNDAAYAKCTSSMLVKQALCVTLDGLDGISFHDCHVNAEWELGQYKVGFCLVQ